MKMIKIIPIFLFVVLLLNTCVKDDNMGIIFGPLLAPDEKNTVTPIGPGEKGNVKNEIHIDPLLHLVNIGGEQFNLINNMPALANIRDGEYDSGEPNMFYVKKAVIEYSLPPFGFNPDSWGAWNYPTGGVASPLRDDGCQPRRVRGAWHGPFLPGTGPASPLWSSSRSPVGRLT